MTAAAILLAAGRGERLGEGGPKALVPLAGVTLLERAVAAAERSDRIEGLIVAAPLGHEDDANAIAAGSSKLIAVMTGGATRRDSVRLAMTALPADVTEVCCHDVARPFAPPRLYGSVLDALAGADGAVPAVPIADTVKLVADGHVLETLARDGLVLVQTPQGFRRAALADAHRRAETEGWEATDDAALLERAGFRVAVVPGDPRNWKVTTPDDLARAREHADG